MTEANEQATDKQAAFEQAEAAASRIPGLLESVVDRLGAHAGAKAIFGEPVEQDGRTIIPVAQAMIGTGAGGGDSESGPGVGAGGGAMTRPLGYIEITSERAAFVPLTQPWQDAKLVFAYSFLVWIVLRALIRIVRG